MKRIKTPGDKRTKRNPNYGGPRPRSGRPKGSFKSVATREEKLDLAKLARDYTKQGLKEIVRIMKEGESDGVRLRAIEMLFDRGYGKPYQSHEITGAGKGPVIMKIDKEQLRGLPEETLDALYALVSGLIRGETERVVPKPKEEEGDGSEYARTLQ